MTSASVPNIGSDLESIHRVISRGLDVAIAQAPRLQADLEGPLREGFLNYLQSLATLIDAHHTTEDELVFAFFRDRVPDMPFDLLMLQHVEMLANVHEMMAALADLREGKQIMGATARTGEALRRLDATWSFHIEVEESHLSPERVAMVATAEEQIELRRRIGEYNAQHLLPAELCIPFVLYNLEVEERAVMASLMPAEVIQELVPGPWKAEWASMRPFLLE